MNSTAFVASAPVVIASSKTLSCSRPQYATPRTGRVSMMADGKSNNPLSALGGMGNFMDVVKKAQQFTSVAKELQEELGTTEIEATVRDGQVRVVMTAQQVPVKVEVSDELVAQGSAEVSAAVTECVIAAHTMSSKYMKEKMGDLTKDFGIPPPPTQ